MPIFDDAKSSQLSSVNSGVSGQKFMHMFTRCKGIIGGIDEKTFPKNNEGLAVASIARDVVEMTSPRDDNAL